MTANSTKAPLNTLVPEHLWQVPIYLPYLQPPLTDKAVAQAEAKLGVKLPQAYLAALRIQNGGYLRLTNHPCERASVDYLAGIGPNFPSLLGRDWDEIKEYMQEEGIRTPERIDALIPFCGDGHTHFCLDYRASGPEGEPCVTYIDVESFDVDEVVAPNFAAFLKQLGPEESSEMYGLVTDAPIEDVAMALSRASGMRFENQGDQDYGYRVFRAALPEGAGWAWLSANLVRRGFVRQGHEDFAKLSGLFPELVHRYPEHADCGAILRCSSFESAQGKALMGSLPWATRAVRCGPRS